MNNYVWLRFNKDKYLWEDKNLSSADIAKIIKMGIYVKYTTNNLTFDNGKYITKKNLNKLLKLSNRAFELFFKTCLEKNIFYFNELNEYKSLHYHSGKIEFNPLELNKEIIRKGYNNRHWDSQKNSDRLKLYIKSTKLLYEDNTYNQIGNMFKLIPFLDFRDNSIEIKEAMNILKYNNEKQKRFLKSFEKNKYILISGSYIIISKKLICFNGLPTKIT